MSVTVTALCKRYGSHAVLQNFSLQLEGPTVLMGPSGCGKTTLLRLMLGLEPPDSGTVQGVGRAAAVFQESRLCPQLTAPANLVLTGHGLPEATAQRELMAMGLTRQELALPCGKLSGGQKRRVALLRALLCRGADTLLLDEPFTGMDADLVALAAETTVRLTAGRPTLLVTHDQQAARLLGWPVVQMVPHAGNDLPR